LDQAELPLDDVSVFLGDVRRSGDGPGLRIRRRFFEQILRSAVVSSFAGGSDEAHAEWKANLASSDVRLQWDPDHDPAGSKLARRAIQLGLRGETLRSFATQELQQVIDMTPLIAEQRPRAVREKWPLLHTPLEHVYEPDDASINAAIGLDTDRANA
jgi:hypothetical protein